MNSVAWAPHEFGLVLACASSDGRVSILEYKQDMWWVILLIWFLVSLNDITVNSFVLHCFTRFSLWGRHSKHFQNDSLGCNAVSWAPANAVGSVTEDGTLIRRLVTGSCDNTVRIWRSMGSDGHWTEEPREAGSHTGMSCPMQYNHISLYNGRVKFRVVTDWVRDVAWAPNTAMPYNTIASCSEDRSVIIWKQASASAPWSPTVMQVFDAPVWRVSWSITGNVLAVSTGDHKVTLWKQSVDESWMQISTVGEGNQPNN